MSLVQLKHFDLLGKKARDKVTGFEGIVECMSYDLYGCIQVTLRPPFRVEKNEKGELTAAHWFDVKRIEVLDEQRVLEIPDFTVPEIGAAEKPSR